MLLPGQAENLVFPRSRTRFCENSGRSVRCRAKSNRSPVARSGGTGKPGARSVKIRGWTALRFLKRNNAVLCVNEDWWIKEDLF